MSGGHLDLRYTFSIQDFDNNLRAMRMEDRGCVVHTPCDWAACQGMHVISYCNGEFLKNLETIKRYAKTATFVNCMTWLFDDEREMHRRGLIDVFMYQTDHSRESSGGTPHHQQ